MKAYLELEGKLGPEPRPQTQPQQTPSTMNPATTNPTPWLGRPQLQRQVTKGRGL